MTNNVIVRPCFLANLNGVNQTGMASGAFTQVVSLVEVYDIGSYFATSAWTPPAGTVSLLAKVQNSVAVTNSGVNAVAIYKDGAVFAQSNWTALSNDASCVVFAEDICTGSNVYTMYGFVTGGTGRAFNGTASLTNFSGFWISQ